MSTSSQSLAPSRSSEETQPSTTITPQETEAHSSDPTSLPSSSPCSTPRPSIDHLEHPDGASASQQHHDRSSEEGVVVGEKRKRDGGEEEEDELKEDEGGSLEQKSNENELNKSTTISGNSRVEKKRTKIWSGDLEEKMTPFDILTNATKPVQEFENSQKGFMEGIMAEFHLVLLELNVWAQHRLSSLQKSSRSKIDQSIEEIQIEERKQEANRAQLFAFMETIRLVVESLGGREVGEEFGVGREEARVEG